MDGIEECAGDGLNAEVDRSEETVVHEDDVTAVGVGDDDLPLRIEEGKVAINDKALPTRVGEEAFDFRNACRLAFDGGLANQEAEAVVCLESAKEDDAITENLVVEVPTFQVVNGRGLVFL